MAYNSFPEIRTEKHQKRAGKYGGIFSTGSVPAVAFLNDTEAAVRSPSTI